MNATELYEDLVYKLTDALLDEAIKFNTRGIQGIRIGADEAGPRRPVGGIKPREERDISDAAKAEHARLKGMLDSNSFTKNTGETLPMPRGLRLKIQGQFDALQSMLGMSQEPTGRDAAKARLDSIMAPDDKPETQEPTGADAFHALFRS